MECVLVFSIFGASLCTLVMFFAICAEVAGGRHTKRSSRIPVSIGPDGGPFAIPAWPVIVRILAVIDHSHGNPLDDITGFQKTTVRVFHKKGNVKILSQV